MSHLTYEERNEGAYKFFLSLYLLIGVWHQKCSSKVLSQHYSMITGDSRTNLLFFSESRARTYVRRRLSHVGRLLRDRNDHIRMNFCLSYQTSDGLVIHYLYFTTFAGVVSEVLRDPLLDFCVFEFDAP
jgi:hypothetical protein